MDGNGASGTAQLASRVAELEAALSLLTRRIEVEWRPRLLGLEEDVDGLLQLVAQQLTTERGP